jgi:hypothetical protein
MPEGLTGSLAQWPLADLLAMLAASRQHGRIEVTNGPERADLYLEEGRVIHAAMGGHVGESVVIAALGWDRGIFSFEARVPSPAVTILRDLDAIMSDAARESEAREEVRRTVPTDAAIPHLVGSLPGAPVTLTPEEWVAVAHIDGAASAGDIAAMLRLDEFELARRLAALAARGLVEVEVPAPARPQQRVALVNPAFFTQLQHAAAAALGPIAAVVVDDALDMLGSPREAFPRERVSQLVEVVAAEIRDDRRRAQFQQTMLQWLRAQAA